MIDIVYDFVGSWSFIIGFVVPTVVAVSPAVGLSPLELGSLFLGTVLKPRQGKGRGK